LGFMANFPNFGFFMGPLQLPVKILISRLRLGP